MRRMLTIHKGSPRFLCGAAAGRRGQPREQYSRARPLRRTSRVIREPPMEGAQLPRTADATARSPCGFGTNDCDICGACLSLTKEAHVFLCGAAAGRCGQPRPGRDWAHVPPGAAPVRTCIFFALGALCCCDRPGVSRIQLWRRLCWIALLRPFLMDKVRMSQNERCACERRRLQRRRAKQQDIRRTLSAPCAWLDLSACMGVRALALTFVHSCISVSACVRICTIASASL